MPDTSAFRGWLKEQPDRPFVILYAHALVVCLYLSGHAVSKVPFKSTTTHALISSPAVPMLHLIALCGLGVGMLKPVTRGGAAGLSLMVWSATTILLYFAATQRMPQLSFWACGFGTVITLATFLMVVRWGVDGDDSEVS